MPLLSDQPSAVTRVYAASLFDLAMSQGGRTRVEESLDELQQVVELAAQQPRLAEILASPSVAGDDRARSIERMFKGRVSQHTLNFLLLLNQKGRIASLPAVVASLDELVQDRFGLVEVDVYTAQPATPDMTRGLADRLSQAIGKSVVLHHYVDPEMIGGVRIKIGDQLLDGSVAMQLRRMKDQLEREGASSLRANLGRAYEA